MWSSGVLLSTVVLLAIESSFSNVEHGVSQRSWQIPDKPQAHVTPKKQLKKIVARDGNAELEGQLRTHKKENQIIKQGQKLRSNSLIQRMALNDLPILKLTNERNSLGTPDKNLVIRNKKLLPINEEHDRGVEFPQKFKKNEQKNHNIEHTDRIQIELKENKGTDLAHVVPKLWTRASNHETKASEKSRIGRSGTKKHQRKRSLISDAFAKAKNSFRRSTRKSMSKSGKTISQKMNLGSIRKRFSLGSRRSSKAGRPPSAAHRGKDRYVSHEDSMADTADTEERSFKLPDRTPAASNQDVDHEEPLLRPQSLEEPSSPSEFAPLTKLPSPTGSPPRTDTPYPSRPSSPSKPPSPTGSPPRTDTPYPSRPPSPSKPPSPTRSPPRAVSPPPSRPPSPTKPPSPTRSPPRVKPPRPSTPPSPTRSWSFIETSTKTPVTPLGPFRPPLTQRKLSNEEKSSIWDEVDRTYGKQDKPTKAKILGTPLLIDDALKDGKESPFKHMYYTGKGYQVSNGRYRNRITMDPDR